MAYTQADLDAVQTAILALAKGERVTSIRFADGKQVQYGEADLPALKVLREEIVREVQAATGRRRYAFASTSKGL
ncbi:MAG: gpW family head-tail joining protein [Desulfocurvibacter africanus]